MTDAIKLKVLPQFPASVQASGGVQLIKENGVYKFSANFGDFTPVATLPSDPNDHVPVYDIATGQTILVPSSQFGGGGGGSGTPSNTNPIMDGTATPGVSALYARGDHVHPTDTSRAAVSALPLPATALPLLESGIGSVGSATRYAREDHVHPAAGGSGDVVGPAGATDMAAARFDLATGKLLKNSSLLIADTTGALSRQGGGGIPIQGMGSNAALPASGFVGEILQSTKSIADDLPITDNVDRVWNSLPLSAGIWLVGGTCGVFRRGAVTPVFIHMHCDHGIGTTTIQTSPAGGATTALHLTSNDPNGWIFPMGIKPYVLTAPATLNCVVLSNFSGGPAIVYGNVWALRFG